MNDLTTYRIDETHDITRAPADTLIMLGVLVPDTRLQDIADAWNELRQLQRQPNTHDVLSRAEYKVTALLDALTEDAGEVKQDMSHR